MNSFTSWRSGPFLALAFALGTSILGTTALSSSAQAQTIVGEARPPSVEVDQGVLDQLGGAPALPDMFLNRRPPPVALPPTHNVTRVPMNDNGRVVNNAPLRKPSAMSVTLHTPHPAKPKAQAKAAAPAPVKVAAKPAAPAKPAPVEEAPVAAAAAPAASTPAAPTKTASADLPPVKLPKIVPDQPAKTDEAPAKPATSAKGSDHPPAPAAPVVAAATAVPPPSDQAIAPPVKAAAAPAPAPEPAPAPAPQVVASAQPAPAAPAPALVPVANAPVALTPAAPAPAADPAPAPVAAAPVVAPTPVVQPPAPPPLATPEPVAKPAQQLASLTPAAPVKGTNANTILFDKDAARLPDASGQALTALATRMNADQGLQVTLMAYAEGDEETASRARRLSLSRALAVRSFLIDQGVRSTRIEVRALGNKYTDGPADRVDVVEQAR